MSVDKVIAIKLPYKHDRDMTRRTVVSIIASLWLFSILVSLYFLFKTDGFTAVSRYAVYLVDEDKFLETSSTFALPVFVELIGTITFVWPSNLIRFANRLRRRLDCQEQLVNLST